MAWNEPKVTWSTNDTLGPSDFNRIEGNTKHLVDMVSNGNNKLKNAIVSKGGSVEGAATFDTVAEGISTIDRDITADATAEPEHIRVGATAYARGKKIHGSMPEYIAKTSYVDKQGATIVEGNGLRINSKAGCITDGLEETNIRGGVTIGSKEHGVTGLIYGPGHHIITKSFKLTIPSDSFFEVSKNIPIRFDDFPAPRYIALEPSPDVGSTAFVDTYKNRALYSHVTKIIGPKGRVAYPSITVVVDYTIINEVSGYFTVNAYSWWAEDLPRYVLSERYVIHLIR